MFVVCTLRVNNQARDHAIAAWRFIGVILLRPFYGLGFRIINAVDKMKRIQYHKFTLSPGPDPARHKLNSAGCDPLNQRSNLFPEHRHVEIGKGKVELFTLLIDGNTQIFGAIICAA